MEACAIAVGTEKAIGWYQVDAYPVKQELRQRLRKGMAGISPEELGTRSLRAAHRLFQTREYVKAEIVMIFLSMETEADTTPIALRAWQDSKRVLTPKVSWNQRRMFPVEIRSLTGDEVSSKMGIREPIAGVPFPVNFIDLLIVPGLGFDEYGNRLGRGRGFYDRFLAHPEFQGISCGFCLESQIQPRLPVGPLDRRVDMVVTDESVRRFKT